MPAVPQGCPGVIGRRRFLVGAAGVLIGKAPGRARVPEAWAEPDPGHEDPRGPPAGIRLVRWQRLTCPVPPGPPPIEVAYLRPPRRHRLDLVHLRCAAVGPTWPAAPDDAPPAWLIVADEAGLVLHRLAAYPGSEVEAGGDRPFLRPVPGRGLILSASAARRAELSIYVAAWLTPLP
jgi:hypothetical protein